MTDKEKMAKRVRDTIQLLNDEIKEAKQLGLDVNVSQNLLSFTSDAPIVTVRICERIKY